MLSGPVQSLINSRLKPWAVSPWGRISIWQLKDRVPAPGASSPPSVCLVGLNEVASAVL